jgi:hypothetical protein
LTENKYFFFIYQRVKMLPRPLILSPSECSGSHQGPFAELFAECEPPADSRQPTADSRQQAAGSRKQEAGSRKQEAGSRKQEAGSRRA